MDTQSKAGSYIPALGAVLGGLGLVFGIVGTVQANNAKKELAEARTALEAKIADNESSVNLAASKAEQARASSDQVRRDMQSVIAQTSKAFEDVSSQFAAVRGDIAKLAAGPKPAPGKEGDKKGAPTIPAGVLQPDGSYVIKAGDTFAKLARQFNIAPAELAKANPGVDSSKLKVGQKIKIPGAKPAATPAPAPAPRT